MRDSDGKIVIGNPARAHQFINFQGLEFGMISPTDVDGLIEYKGNYIIYEFKHGQTPMPPAQKYAFQHLVDALQRARKNAVLFLCSHNVADPREDVKAAEAEVTAVYYNGRWKKITGETVKDMTQRFLAFAGVL